MSEHRARSSCPSAGAMRTARWVFLIFLAVAGVFLILEHRAHLLGAWPLILLLVCVGAHLFMHRGRAQGGKHGH